MSVKDRIEDAQVLYENGRYEGALVSILMAVAATSRKRYPYPEELKLKGRKGQDKNSDNYIFRKFISEEMPKLAPGWSEDKPLPIKFQGEQLLLPEVLYRYIRCELFHKAKLPTCIKFKNGKGLNVTVLNNQEITFTKGLISFLTKIVVEAPENNDLFKRK